MTKSGTDDISALPAEAPAERGLTARMRRTAATKRLLVVSGLLVGGAGLAGVALGIHAMVPRFASLSGLAFMPDLIKPRRKEIRIGPLAEMPAIQDGVPAIVGSKGPVRVIAMGPAAESGAPSTPTAPVTAAALDPARIPARTPGADVQSTSALAADPIAVLIRADAAVEPQPRPSVRMAASPSSVPAARMPPSPSLLAAAPMGAVPAPFAPPLTAAAPPDPPSPRGPLAVPLPPPAPSRAAVARLETRPERTAPARAPRVAASAASPSQPNAAPAPSAAEEDDVDVLGVRLPGIASTGRRLREAAEAISDAVTGLPGRL